MTLLEVNGQTPSLSHVCDICRHKEAMPSTGRVNWDSAVTRIRSVDVRGVVFGQDLEEEKKTRAERGASNLFEWESGKR